MGFRLSLPVAPLLKLIESRGGLAETLERANIEKYDPDRSPETSEYGRVSKEYEAIERRLKRAEKSGYVSFFWADEFCCEYLRMHPLEVFGEGYFTPSRGDELAASTKAELLPAAA